MKLPNGDKAIIDPQKLTDYSLSPNHDDGGAQGPAVSKRPKDQAKNPELALDAL